MTSNNELSSIICHKVSGKVGFSVNMDKFNFPLLLQQRKDGMDKMRVIVFTRPILLQQCNGTSAVRFKLDLLETKIPC